MNIAVSCKNDSFRCFEVKLITFNPETGIKIYGEKDFCKIYISPKGEIKTPANLSEWQEVVTCEIKGDAFRKSKEEERKNQFDEEVEDSVIMYFSKSTGGSAVTIEKLYNNLKMAMLCSN